MTAPPFIHRAQAALVEVARDYPNVWRAYDTLIHDVRQSGVTWPEWCWAPMAAAYAIASGGGHLPAEKALDVGRLAALGAWRLTQGIYRLDDTLLSELWDSDVEGALPVETLFHLPEWCVYVETPGRAIDAQSALHGFWAHLENDSNDGRAELRLLLDTDGGLLPAPLHLGKGKGTLADAAWGTIDEAIAVSARKEGPIAAEATAIASSRLQEGLERLRPLVSIVLYLCTTAEELRADDGRTPTRPRPRPGRRGEAPRNYPPAAPAYYPTGLRLGAALRAARDRAVDAPAAATGTGASPAGHVRRAHWHTFLLGPRDGQQRREVRWLPPILVRLEPDAVAPVIRPVR
jgi:hypothetical protein